MPVGAIAGTTPTQFKTPTTETSNTTLDRQAFLKLLVAQLKYQDPSKPMDASEMISQSAQLSVVEKLNEIASTLTSSGISNRLMLAGSVIGKQVTFPDADGAPVSATVSSVRFVSGVMVLAAGEWDVPISAVSAIAPAPVAPATVTPAPVTTPASIAPLPIAADPATAVPVTAHPAIADPAIADPAITDPAFADPAIADPTDSTPQETQP